MGVDKELKVISSAAYMQPYLRGRQRHREDGEVADRDGLRPAALSIARHRLREESG
jgi:hypothetical protein